jgi:lantibiotic modifying enzyme
VRDARPWGEELVSLVLRGAPSGHVRAVVSARVIALPWPCELEAGVVDDLTEHLLRSLRPLGTSAAHAEGPVWSPLMAEVCARWSHQLAELVDRLHDDLAALQATFGLSGATRLQRIFAGLSDPHHGGRTVHILCFHSARVVYKPRSIEIERRALEVMGWLGEQVGHTLRGVRTLPRPQHAWCEHVEEATPRTAAEAHALCWGAGVLAFACYLLGVTDCHANNVRASGADLVLIDAETTLHPDFHPELVPWTQPEDSVLRSGLIHTLRPLVRDGAGREAVLGGFERAWSVVASDVSLQRGVAERINTLAEHESRVVFRATQAYSQLLARSLSPAASGTSPRREDLLRASLEEPFGVTGIPRPLRPLVERELLALGALDVPRFTAMPGGVDVYDAGERVAEGVLRRAGLEVAQDRLADLSAERLAWMQALLFVTFTPTALARSAR